MEGFTPRLDREIQLGQLVGIHWNSHQNVYSVVEFKSRKMVGKVLGYVDRITLADCTVKIDISKQISVRKLNRKDRHAFIVGCIESVGKKEKLPNGIYYNPYKLDSFVNAQEYLKQKHTYLDTMKKVNFDYNHQSGKPEVTYC